MIRNILDIYSNTTIKSRQMLKRPAKFIRVCAWLGSHRIAWDKVDKENGRQSDIERKSVPRRKARRLKFNWDPDEDKGEDNGNEAERSHGPIITTFSSKSRRLFTK